MSAPIRTALLTGALTCAFHSSVYAQNARPASPRFEAAIGVQWLGSSSLGSRDANLTTGTGGALRLFSTSTTMSAVPGVEGRLGVRAHRRVDVEAFGAYAKPLLQTQIANDLENPSTTTAAETIKQYVVGGSVVWYLPERARPKGLRPFVIGSAAYLRQLHNSDTLAVTGRLFEGGVGVKYPLVTRQARRSGHSRIVGIRADVRAQARLNGAAFDDRVHFRPVATASAFVRF